jgi:hypothetical protein
VHYSTQKSIELIPDKKVVWPVTDSNLSIIKNTNEWIGTKISFDINKKGDKTVACFTRLGSMPEIEYFEPCLDAWGGYIKISWPHLITTGKGRLTQKE